MRTSKPKKPAEIQRVFAFLASEIAQPHPYNSQYLLLSLLVSRNYLGGQMATNKLTGIEAKQANTHPRDYKITDSGVPSLCKRQEKIREHTGQFKLLFPSERRITDSINDNSMRGAIFRLGYDGSTEGKAKCVPHGLLTNTCSILNEQGFNPGAIERQMRHMERDDVRAACTPFTIQRLPRENDGTAGGLFGHHSGAAHVRHQNTCKPGEDNES